MLSFALKFFPIFREKKLSAVSNLKLILIFLVFFEFPAEEAFEKLLKYEHTKEEELNQDFLEEYEKDMMEISVIQLPDNLENPEQVKEQEEEKEPQQKEEVHPIFEICQTYLEFEE